MMNSSIIIMVIVSDVSISSRISSSSSVSFIFNDTNISAENGKNEEKKPKLTGSIVYLYI